MRFTSCFYNGNEISVHNSIWGVESVRYNGEKMTSIFSFGGATHEFSVYEEDILVTYRIEIALGLMGVGVSIWRNGETLLLGRGASCRRNVASRDTELV